MTPHTCQTTFAGGVNPWGEYVPFVSTKPKTTQQNLLALLADGKPRSSTELTNALCVTPSHSDAILRRLMQDGRIGRVRLPFQGPNPRCKAVYVYSLLETAQ